MALWDKLMGELVDIVEWLDDTKDTLSYRFERYQNEIKYGAKLVVREGQMAAFINEGKLADVFRPGTYELTTQNLPILSTLSSAGITFLETPPVSRDQDNEDQRAADRPTARS